MKEVCSSIVHRKKYYLAGTFFGVAVSAAWIMSLGGYQASGPIKMRALRYVIGLIGVIIL